MRKVGILVLAFALVVGMSFGVMAENGNDGYVDQKNNSDLTFEQYGSGNYADILQDSSKASVVQIGENNSVDLDQKGGSEAVIYHAEWYNGFTDKSIKRNTAKIFQENNAYVQVQSRGEDNTVNIDQRGKNDTVFAWQFFSDNSIDIDQLSGESFATVFQTGDHVDDKVVSDIDNYGSNTVLLEQKSSDAAFFQDGRSNTVKLKQKNGSLFPTGVNKDKLLPYGEWSSAFFEQKGINNRLLGIDSNGNHKSWAYQNNSFFTGDQKGNNNTIRLHQEFSNATITQSGNNNNVSLYQNTADDNTSYSNEATINQIGVSGNTVKVSQIGNKNSATVEQNSDNNMVDLEQNGNGNEADIIQGSN